MKHELLYETQAQFRSAQGTSGNVTSIKPGVAHIIENDTVGFNYNLVNLLIEYNVDDISSATKIYSGGDIKTNLYEIIVDKTHIPASAVTNTYQFENTGRHIIRYRYTSLTTIPTSGFTRCSAVVGVKFPNTITTINTYAFTGTKLKKVVFPKNITKISNQSFSGCTLLDKVIFKNEGNKSILVGVRAFEKTAVTNVYAENETAWMRIGWDDTGMFGYNGGTALHNLYIGGEKIETFVIPETFTNISQEKFYGCSNIKHVVFPNTITSIGKQAFYRCQNLKEINLPNSLKTIGVQSFMNCSSASGDLVLPSSVTSVSSESFRNCSALSALTLSESLTTIGASAFTNCYGLENNLVIPSGITTINAWAFYGCTKLSGELIIPIKLTTVGSCAFEYCKSISGTLIIPATLTNIGDRAFSGMQNLTNITIEERSSSVRADVFAYHNVSGKLTYTGNKQGVFEAFCNMTRGGDVRMNFKKILLHGNYSAPTSGGYFITCCNTLKEFRIDGDYSGGTVGLLHTYNDGAAQLEFIEILGNATGMIIYGSGSATAIKNNAIIHIGYDNKTDLVPSNIFSSNYVSSQNIKVYFGDGSSQEHDQNILNKYLENAEWAAKSSQLDIWYNYTGEYRE